MTLAKFDAHGFKITVEEVMEHRKDGENITHIATFWDKELFLEADRYVYEFETFGGAMYKAFDLLTDVLEGYVAEGIL